SARQFLAFEVDEIAVHQEETLERDRGREALFGRDVWTGKIEGLKILIELVAADAAVDGAARECWREFGRGASDRIVEVAGYHQDGIAKLLGIEPLAVGAPIEAIARILGVVGFVVVRAELIYRTKHDFAVELLQGHSVVT